jgi:hypothetical protein
MTIGGNESTVFQVPRRVHATPETFADRMRMFQAIPMRVVVVMPTPTKPTERSENESATEDVSTPAGEVEDLRKLAEEEGATVTPDVSPEA